MILTLLTMVVALSVNAQSDAKAYAYIFDSSGTSTNVRNAPNGKVVQKLPEIDGGYVVALLEVKNQWWKIDPVVELYGDYDEDEHNAQLLEIKSLKP